MKKEEKTTNTGNRKRSAWRRLFARTHRLPAHVTREREWQTDVPNIRLSRAFVIVLIIHVVAVGGILAFEMFKPRATAQNADASSMATAGSPTTDLERSAGSVDRAGQGMMPLPDGYVRHIVQSRDSLQRIADRYGLKKEDITRVNTINDRNPLRQGRVLTIPKPTGSRAAESGLVATGNGRTTTRVAPIAPAEDPASSLLDTPPPIDLESNANEYKPSEELPLFGSEKPEPGKSAEEKKEVAGNGKDDHSDWLKGPDLETPAKIVSPDPLVPSAPRRNGRPQVQKKIPAADGASVATKKATGSGRTYTVRRGDTFYAIGRKFGVKYQEILKANGISDPRHLQAGQVLRIP